jgi:hypothetical protein
MVLNKRALQKLVNKAYEFNCDWRLQFNPSKCAIVVYGKDNVPSKSVTLGGNKIEVKPSHTHVGTLLSDSTQETIRYVQERIGACKRMGHAINAIGTRSAPITPKAASHIYWSSCVPKLTYGLEVMDLSRNAIARLEILHADIAKSLQGLPQQTCNIGAVGSLGWMSIKAHIDIKRLLFMWQVAQLGMASLYKKVFICRFVCHMYGDSSKHCGPLWQAIKTCKEYDLMDMVEHAVQSGDYMDIREWKRLVKNKVWARENQKWSIICRLYSSLSTVKQGIPSIKLWSWWQYVQDCPSDMHRVKVILKLLLNVHGLKCSAARYTGNGASVLCEQCDHYQAETISHVLFECIGSADLRSVLWADVMDACPPALVLQINTMLLEDKVVFLLTGLHSTYTQEWFEVFACIARYISSIYWTHIDNTA